MVQSIDFYFDFSSPYGYIASRLIDDLAARNGCQVRWRPILLGAVFKLTAAAPLTGIPMKGEYSIRDFARTARLYGIPFEMPDPFPFSGIAANRAFYWLEASDPVGAHKLAQALYDAAFSGHPIASPDSVADVAAGLGHDRAAVLAGIASPEAKDAPAPKSEASIARGVFGSPFFFIGEEGFWGCDRLDQVERWLKTGGW